MEEEGIVIGIALEAVEEVLPVVEFFLFCEAVYRCWNRRWVRVWRASHFLGDADIVQHGGYTAGSGVCSSLGGECHYTLGLKRRRCERNIIYKNLKRV